MNSRRASTRITDAQAFVLHMTSWRETSVIAKIWSREHGLVLAVGKGAKRPYSGLRAVLQIFQPLRLSWSGRNELKTLIGAQVDGFYPMPSRALMSGWYMNEIILKLVAREDPHPLLFDAYAMALQRLCANEPLSATLRQFEWILLREAGYGIDAQTPDFSDAAVVEALRGVIRERLDQSLADAQLMSREVMRGLRQVG